MTVTMDEEAPRYALIRFHPDSDAFLAGKQSGVVDREYGAVFPFATEAEAREKLPQFVGAVPDDQVFPWEPHYSTEYDEID